MKTKKYQGLSQVFKLHKWYLGLLVRKADYISRTSGGRFTEVEMSDYVMVLMGPLMKIGGIFSSSQLFLLLTYPHHQ